MNWIILILFPQTSNFRIMKLCCMCLKTTKQWSRCLEKEDVGQWDMVPEPTELRLIGYSIESVWTKNPNQAHRHQKPTCRDANLGKFLTWRMESSCIFSTLAISVLQIVLKWCRKEHRKIQVKKESQQSQNRWWIWFRDTAKRLLMCYLLLLQKARRKPDTRVKILWVRKLSSII